MEILKNWIANVAAINVPHTVYLLIPCLLLGGKNRTNIHLLSFAPFFRCVHITILPCGHTTI